MIGNGVVSVRQMVLSHLLVASLGITWSCRKIASVVVPPGVNRLEDILARI